MATFNWGQRGGRSRWSLVTASVMIASRRKSSARPASTAPIVADSRAGVCLTNTVHAVIDNDYILTELDSDCCRPSFHCPKCLLRTFS